MGKLREARELVQNNQIRILDELPVAVDAIELGYSIELELQEVLLDLLLEVTPVGYSGTRPPQRSYEKEIKGLELFPFSLQSSYFDGQEVYFKFALKNNFLWLVSLHEDRPEKK